MKDELAETATDPEVTRDGPTPSNRQLAGTLDHFNLEHQLGAGGMGVVYAAFDTRLERRVALKLLPHAHARFESSERLFREARAMARLTHPNVVTVYEVGSVNGRDYVAMELIDGTDLATWLRAARHRPRDIVAAFIAAGHGLAAAHAAGIVHRDFKPHNVLRRKDGRILVTDFGLARGVDLDEQSPAPAARNTPSPLGGSTETGSVLGTPAYMAPEQWLGKPVGPATDQFAFCVALWEALAGERPYARTSLDDARSAILRGPAELDASKIPRALRDMLRRGLQPDAADRWPSMDALIARLERSQRRVLVPMVLGAAITLTLGAIAIVLAGPTDRCRPPALDPSVAWRPELRASIALPVARALDRDFTSWRVQRAAACKAEPAHRERALACLDSVIQKLDLVARVAREHPHQYVPAMTPDPTLCAAVDPPRLAAPTPELRSYLAALTEYGDGLVTDVEVDKWLAIAGNDPCTSVLAHGTASFVRTGSSTRRREIEAAEDSAQRCRGEDILAIAALASARFEIAAGTPAARARLSRAELAVDRVPQPEILGQLDELRMIQAQRDGQIDRAIELGERAIHELMARDRIAYAVGITQQVVAMRRQRASSEDIAAIPKLLHDARALAVNQLGASDEAVRRIDVLIATWDFANGDVAGAHARLARLWQPMALHSPHHISGRVVDTEHHPVAGASVIAASNLEGDAVGIALMSTYSDARITTTNAAGEFDLPEAADGVVIAQQGDLRSIPTPTAEHVELVLEPTSRIEGTIALNGFEPTNVWIAGVGLGKGVSGYYQLRAPVLRDGTFSLAGVPRDRFRLRVEVEGSPNLVTPQRELTVRDPVVRVDLTLAASPRRLHVLVRSTVAVDVSGAWVHLFSGTVTARTQADLPMSSALAGLQAQPIDRDRSVPDVAARARPGDFIVEMTGVPDEPGTVCATPFPRDQDPALLRKSSDHPERIEVHCVPVSTSDDVVVVPVAPFPRFD